VALISSLAGSLFDYIVFEGDALRITAIEAGLIALAAQVSG
jgi:hypothetical protein